MIKMLITRDKYADNVTYIIFIDIQQNNIRFCRNSKIKKPIHIFDDDTNEWKLNDFTLKRRWKGDLGIYAFYNSEGTELTTKQSEKIVNNAIGRYLYEREKKKGTKLIKGIEPTYIKQTDPEKIYTSKMTCDKIKTFAIIGMIKIKSTIEINDANEDDEINTKNYDKKFIYDVVPIGTPSLKTTQYPLIAYSDIEISPMTNVVILPNDCKNEKNKMFDLISDMIFSIEY